jgi:hypothetical protein
MSEEAKHERLPRSVRKHLRQRKATLRRELPPEKAARAIDRLLREFRR